MASYSKYSDMDTYSSRLVFFFHFLLLLRYSSFLVLVLTFRYSEIKREKIPYSIATSSDSYKPTTTMDESLPRTLLQPLAMNSPLNSDTFALWPPTPRNPSDMPTTSGPEHYMYSTAESIEHDTHSPWDPALLCHDEHSPPPVTDCELPTSHCGSSVEGELQNIPRIDQG